MLPVGLTPGNESEYGDEGIEGENEWEDSDEEQVLDEGEVHNDIEYNGGAGAGWDMYASDTADGGNDNNNNNNAGAAGALRGQTEEERQWVSGWLSFYIMGMHGYRQGGGGW